MDKNLIADYRISCKENKKFDQKCVKIRNDCEEEKVEYERAKAAVTVKCNALIKEQEKEYRHHSNTIKKVQLYLNLMRLYIISNGILEIWDVNDTKAKAEVNTAGDIIIDTLYKNDLIHVVVTYSTCFNSLNLMGHSIFDNNNYSTYSIGVIGLNARVMGSVNSYKEAEQKWASYKEEGKHLNFKKLNNWLKKRDDLKKKYLQAFELYKNREWFELFLRHVDKEEMLKVFRSKREDLPILIGALKGKDAINYLERRLKGNKWYEV